MDKKETADVVTMLAKKFYDVSFPQFDNNNVEHVITSVAKTFDEAIRNQLLFTISNIVHSEDTEEEILKQLPNASSAELDTIRAKLVQTITSTASTLR